MLINTHELPLFIERVSILFAILAFLLTNCGIQGFKYIENMGSEKIFYHDIYDTLESHKQIFYYSTLRGS